MPEKIRITIADDHPVLRRGLRAIIEEDSALQVVSEADDGMMALQQLEQFHPQVLVLDATMPKLDGIETLKQIVEKKLPVEVLFLTFHDGEDLFRAALELGAKGFVLKQSALTEIVTGIRSVAAGQHYWSPALTPYFVGRGLKERALAEANPSIARLTASERRILRMVADGKSSKEIAAELFIHYKTVENHRTQICEKLGLRGGPNSLSRYPSQNKNNFY